jgi:small subunit ribosomal protein S21
MAYLAGGLRQGSNLAVCRDLSGEGGDTPLAQIQVRQNESIDSALKRFKKALEQSGILQEYKRHTHYEKPSERRRRQKLKRRKK